VFRIQNERAMLSLGAEVGYSNREGGEWGS
jgi:hypothetical protein